MTMVATSPEKPASRGLVVTGFIAATLLTTGLGGVVTYFVGIQTAKQQAEITDRTEQVNRFKDNAEALDPLVSAFVREIAQKRVTKPTRDAIKANLITQRSTLESVEVYLREEDLVLARRYEAALVAADAGLKASNGPLDSRAFVQAVADLAGLRPKLFKALHDK